jgi:hypothetical protein
MCGRKFFSRKRAAAIRILSDGITSGKYVLLYELVTSGTTEEGMAKRRK